MGFSSYKYTFRLNASHSNVGKASSVHLHTFEIALYMKPRENAFVEYNQTEKVVRDYLDRFTGKNLNTIPPFDETPPTIENMGEVFFTHLSGLLRKEDFDLIKLEVSENPQRIFNISQNDMSAEKMRRLIRSVENVLRSRSKVATEGITSSPTPAPTVADPIDVPEPLKPSDSLTKGVPPCSNYIFLLQVAVLIVAGAVAMALVKASDFYPLGLDIHGHLFKSDLMYKEILKGNLYPLFTELWYNGVQPFRYWAPLPYYCLAFLQMLTRGDVMNAYLGFVWLSFSVGGIGWLLFGRKLRRPWLGMFFAITWFLLPDNLRVFFGEGNLPRMFIAMLLPYIFYCLWQFVCYRRKKMIFPLMALMPMAILGHLMIAAMVGVASAIFLFVYAIANKRWIESIQALFAMFFTFAVSGIWVFPALMGGLTSMSSEATEKVMISTSEELWVSLNPSLRLNGGIGILYMGLSLVLFAVVGLILSNRKSVPGFLTFLVFVIGTASALTPLILFLPLSEYFWVSRFIPIAYALLIIAVMEWKTLKRKVLIVLCVILFIDTVPSVMLHEYNKIMNIPATHETISASMDELLLTDAKEITKQRVSLMDLSSLGPMPSYAFGTVEPKTQYVFGWAWQGARTAMNIAYLNESLEKDNFLYMFDRSVELGADVILIDKFHVNSDIRKEMLFEAASRVGYQLIKESERTLLFSYPVDSTFGVITRYDCLAIGTTAAMVPGILPYYHPGDELYIDDYSVEELVKYKKIYLSGFFYNNRNDAESLVREIADRGVQVFIDMSRIPADPLTNRMTFLDIDAQPITFSNSYPNLVTENTVIRPKLFAEDYETWNTVYLNGLKNSTGYAWFENSPRLDFIGTGDNKNITFIGFNILFHAYVADDYEVKEILNNVMDLQEDNLPDRKIVPITVEYTTDTITIRSEYDNVNTTIAYQDIFESEQPIRSMNNFLIVDRGTTVIRMSYPHLAGGLLVTMFGIVAEIVMAFLIFRKSKTKSE
ncbi:MAG: 6-pyruvoyl-tetrahydropterin synthase-related protein [Oscillospiraceae bacterium]|nr:6-pyruvoyl-tetrahydropterin synthase-related protein [Oscillospiraceae bacterium]